MIKKHHIALWAALALGTVLLFGAAAASAEPTIPEQRRQAETILAQVQELDAQVGASARSCSHSSSKSAWSARDAGLELAVVDATWPPPLTHPAMTAVAIKPLKKSPRTRGACPVRRRIPIRIRGRVARPSPGATVRVDVRQYSALVLVLPR